MSAEVDALRELLQAWEPRVVCPQCGQRYLAWECGFTHGMILTMVYPDAAELDRRRTQARVIDPRTGQPWGSPPYRMEINEGGVFVFGDPGALVAETPANTPLYAWERLDDGTWKPVKR